MICALCDLDTFGTSVGKDVCVLCSLGRVIDHGGTRPWTETDVAYQRARARGLPTPPSTPTPLSRAALYAAKRERRRQAADMVLTGRRVADVARELSVSTSFVYTGCQENGVRLVDADASPVS